MSADEWQETIAKAQHDKTPEARTAAAQHLSDLARSDAKNASDQTVASITALLDGPDDGVRYWAARCLGNLGDRAKASIPALEKTLLKVDCIQGSKTSASGIRFALGQLGVTPPPPNCADRK